MEIKIAKAQSCGRERRPPNTTIVIDGREKIPVFIGDNAAFFKESNAFYSDQANAIVDALTRSLPGGTLDRVVVELLRRKASHFIVAYGMEKK